MSKQKTAPAAERGALAFDTDGLLAMNQRSIDAMTRMNTQIYQNMMRVHTELLDFTNRRLRADIEVAQKLTGGGKLDDAAEAVYGFQRQIISDYADEASELVNMSTSMAGNLIQEIEDDVEEGTGEGEVDVKKVIYEFQRKLRKISSDYADEASELVKMSTSMAGDLLIWEIKNDVKKGAAEGEVDVKTVADEASEHVKLSTSTAGDLLIREIEDDVKEGAAEAAGAVAAEAAPLEPQAAQTCEEAVATGPVITLKAPPEKTSEPDLQKVILDVLSGSDEALALAEIARQIGTVHHAALIRPMRSLRETGRVVKDEKLYRLA
jgi:hypothetical protein